MFSMLLCVAILCFLGGSLWAVLAYITAPLDDKSKSTLPGIGIACVGVLGLVVAFSTAGGQLTIARFLASGKAGNWLVVDNSGGQTLRHWVLEGGYCESSSQSDGWQFYDSAGNLCYVSGDAFVMKIGQPLGQFKESYRAAYNIPGTQEALH